MKDYILQIRTMSAAPSPEVTFTLASEAMAVDYAKRILTIYGRADWVMGGDLFVREPDKRIASFETQSQVAVITLP